MVEVTLDDVRHCYNFFLGRDAEQGAPLEEWFGGLERALVVANFVNSAEFSENVVRDVLDGKGLSAPVFQSMPSQSILVWACEFLPLSKNARSQLLRCRTWIDVFIIIFGDEAFLEQLPNRNSAEITEGFTRALLKTRGVSI